MNFKLYLDHHIYETLNLLYGSIITPNCEE